MTQRIIVSLRRSFSWLSQQTTGRDGHLGGDISFLCQLVNRRSHQTAECRQRGDDPKPQCNQFTHNKQFYRFPVKISCLTDIIVITNANANVYFSHNFSYFLDWFALTLCFWCMSASAEINFCFPYFYLYIYPLTQVVGCVLSTYFLSGILADTDACFLFEEHYVISS